MFSCAMPVYYSPTVPSILVKFPIAFQDFFRFHRCGICGVFLDMMGEKRKPQDGPGIGRT